MIKLFFISLLFISSICQAQIQSSGNITLIKISPFWDNYLTFPILEESDSSFTRTYYFSSSISQTINENPILSGSSNFTLVSAGSSDCKNGFSFTTSNTCQIKVKFENNYSANASYSSNLSWNGFNLNLSGNISLKVPLYKTIDINGKEVSFVNLNTLFEGENNLQTRTLYLKDLNRATLTPPSITLTNSNFTMSANCTAIQINSDSGCAISYSFNSQSKTAQTFLGTSSVAGIPISISAIVLPLVNKGTTSNYIVTTSNGEVVTSLNIGTFSKFKEGSKETRLYLRDANRLVVNQLNYTIENPITQFSSVYSSCSASNLKSATGCLFRINFFHANNTPNSYGINFQINSSTFLSLTGTIDESNPYSKSSNYKFIDIQSGKILNSLLIGSELPGSSGVTKNFYLKDLNESTFPTTGGLVFSGLSSPFSIVYNQCDSSKSLLNTQTNGCLIKINGAYSSPAGTYSQSLSANVGNFEIPVEIHVLGNSCSPYSSQSCLISHGIGAQICNASGTSYGNCNLVSCNESYHFEEGVCVNDERNCSIENGTGIELWLGNQWSYQCNLISCNSNFHSSSNTCLPDTQNCTITNGTGLSTWSGNDWGACEIITCNNGFHIENNLCLSDVKPYNGTPFDGANEMILRFNQNKAANAPSGSSDNYDIEVSSCNIGYFLENNSCSPLGTVIPNGVRFLTGNLSCPRDDSNDGWAVSSGDEDNNDNMDYLKAFFNPVTNKTTCQSLENASIQIVKTGSADSADASYATCSNLEYQVGNPIISGDNRTITCKAKMCQPTYDLVVYNMYTDHTAFPLSSGYLPGKTLKGSCTRTCLPDGSGFSSCDVTSCDTSAGYYFNRINNTCEAFSGQESNSDYVMYNVSGSAKYYLEIKNKNKKLGSIKKNLSGTSKCFNYNYSISNNVRQLECIYGTSSFPYGTRDHFLPLVDFETGQVTTSADSNLNSTTLIPSLADLNPIMETSIETTPSYTEIAFSYNLSIPKKPFYSCGSGFKQYVTGRSLINEESKPIYGACEQISKCSVGSKKMVLVEPTVSTTLVCSQQGTFPNNSFSFITDTTSVSCIGDTVSVNNECIPVKKACIGSSIPENATAGSKYYRHYLAGYSACYADGCINGFHIETDYYSGEYLTSCQNNIKVCNAIANGANQKEWNVSSNSYGSCSIVCNSTAHSESGGCALNTQEVSIANGIQTKTWNGSSYDYSYACNPNYHEDNNSCVFNTQTCQITNNSQIIGSGMSYWSNNQWGTCLATSCSSGWYINNNTCTKIINISELYNNTSVSSGQKLNFVITGGSGIYLYSLSSNSGKGSSFVVNGSGNEVVYTAGSFDQLSSVVTETLRVTDSNGHSSDFNILFYPKFALCTASPPLDGADTMKKEWDNLNRNYGSCSLIASCINNPLINSVYHLYNNQCFADKKSCNPNDANANSGEQLYIGNGQHSSCYSKTCVNNSSGTYNIYTYSQFDRKCETRHTCSREEIESSDPAISAITPLVEYGNYQRIFNTSTWGRCEIDPSGLGSQCQFDTVANKDRIYYSKVNGNQYCITACSSEEVMKNADPINLAMPSCTPISRITSLNNTFNGVFNGLNVGQCNEVWNSLINDYECEPNSISCISGYDFDSTTPKPRCVPSACISGNERIKASFCNDPQLISLPNKGNVLLPTNQMFGFNETKFIYQQLPESIYPNAKCYDGESQGGFFYRKGHGSGANRWVIVLQGGGACGILPPLNNPNYIYSNINDNNICNKIYNEGFNGLPNSSIINYKNSLNRIFLYPQELFTNKRLNNFQDLELAEDEAPIENIKPFENNPSNLGIVSYLKTKNSNFYSWNHIIIKYCSQDSWVGNGGNNGIHNGHKILFSAIDFLKTHNDTTLIPLNSLNNSKQVIVTGYSAGAIGLAYHGDALSSYIKGNQEKDISFLIDSGELPRISMSNTLTYEQVFNYNGTNLWNKYIPSINEPSLTSNPSYSFFVSDTNISTNTFIIQDLLDYEFLNLNSHTANENAGTPPQNPNQPLEVIIPGNLPEIYPCQNGEPNQNQLNVLLDFINTQFNSSGNLLLNKYEGLIFSKGIHTYGVSKDWADSNRSSLTFNSTTLSAEEWFSQWYFEENLIPIKSGTTSPSTTEGELELLMNSKCSLINSELNINQ